MANFTDRYTAIANKATHYKTGRPCRRGHNADRYSANGMCVECSKINEEVRSERVRKQRIIANTALLEPASVFRGLAKAHLHNHLSDVCDVFQYGTEAQMLILIEAIQAVRSGVQIGKPVRSQGELDRAALAQHVDLTVQLYTDGAPLHMLNDADGYLFVEIEDRWYRGDALKAVWDGLRDIVRPTTPRQ